MFDYERYDHTYCRLNKDIEDPGTLKRRFSSASCDGLSDVDLNDHLTTQIAVERDNGVSLNREPVIIVRTKKARKTAPIIVKAMNKDGGAVLVSAVNTANNSNSIISKNKIVSPVIEPAAVEDIADNHEMSPPEVHTDENIAADSAVATSIDEVVDIIRTTKSGRPRKLTAKAKQISEETVSKSRKSPKVKPDIKELAPKRSRGRPKKTPVVNKIEPVPRSNQSTTPKPSEDINAESTGSSSKMDADEQSMSNGDSQAANQKASTTRRHKTNKVDKVVSLPAKRISKASAKLVQAKEPLATKPKSKASTKKSVTTKRSVRAATKSKLVVVTKPPPKRRAQLRAEEQIATRKSSQNIPAAKIDSSNIVRGRRRR